MAFKAVNYKNWCIENITPQSWSRLLLKAINTIRAEGYTIKQLENPDEDFELSDDLYSELNKALSELYEMQVEEAAIS